MSPNDEYNRIMEESKKLFADPQIFKCTCSNTVCEYHGKCKECIALHRHYDKIPACLQPIFDAKVAKETL